MKSSNESEKDFETLSSDSSESDSFSKPSKATPKSKKEKRKEKPKQGNNITSFVTTNNTNIIQQSGNKFYINNNFYNRGPHEKFPNDNPKPDCRKDAFEQNKFCNKNELSDVILILNNLNTEAGSKIVGLANLVIIFVIIVVSFIILFLGQNNARSELWQEK